MLAAILAVCLLVTDLSPHEPTDMVVTSGTLNINQVFNLLQRNGATPTEAATLAGISVWEAGGGNPNAINPEAFNKVSPDYSVGLFQYNFRAGNFNPSNPMASTRGGFTPGDLLGSLDAQAQSAIALLRSVNGNYSPTWSTYRPHLSSIQGFVNQLLNGGGTTDIPAQPSEGATVNPTVDTTTTAATEPSTNATGPPTGFNLGFTGSLQHIAFQFILLLLAIALLLGGIYLLGSRK